MRGSLLHSPGKRRVTLYISSMYVCQPSSTAFSAARSGIAKTSARTSPKVTRIMCAPLKQESPCGHHSPRDRTQLLKNRDNAHRPLKRGSSLFSIVQALSDNNGQRITGAFDGFTPNSATHHAPQNHAGNGLDGLPARVRNPKHHPSQSRRLAGASERSLPRMGAHSFQRRHLRRDMLDCILVHSSHPRAGASVHGGDVCEHFAMACKI